MQDRPSKRIVAAISAGLASFFLLTQPAWAIDLEIPPVATTRMDEPKVFSSATFDAPRLVGELEDGESVTLSTDGGTLTLSGTAGITFSSGGQGEDSMTFEGSLTDINNALDGLSFAPPGGFAGGSHVTLSVGGTSATWRVSVNALIDAEAARSQILDGVTQVHSGVQPGRMVAYGPEAYDVAWYLGELKEGPMMAVASLGKGRVLATPDHQFLNMDSYGDVSGTFYKNGLAWAGGKAGLNLKIVTRSQGVVDWLKGQGYTSVTKTNNANLAADLLGADVYVPPWLGTDVSEDILETIGDFVRAGGGLFISDYGEGYLMWWGKPVHMAPGNLLLREAGIGFTSGIRWDSGAIDATGVATGQLTGTTLVSMLVDPTAYDAQELERGGTTFGRISDALHPDDPLLKTLDSHFWSLVETITPTPQSPVSSAWEKGLLARELTLITALPPEEVSKHRSADPVFGQVPDDAPRLTRSATVDPMVTRWHSTGLYLPPGEVMEVSVPQEALGKGYKLWISGHRDDISGKDKWLRMPRVNAKIDINAESLEVATPFGGAIYVATGPNPLDLPPFELAFMGVVEAPYFVLGETTDEAWIGGIRDLPAPYAELKCPNLQISLPSQYIRELEDPTDLMTFWQGVVDAQDELGVHADLRTNGERINIDVQISAGYLHSGYPTQGPHQAAPELADLEKLTTYGSWGWFHELGHEAQRRADKSWGSNNPYTFDDSVECTVNLFTTYVYETFDIGGGWAWGRSRYETMKRAREVLSQGETYGSVGVGHKLAMFLELRHGWEWKTFQEVFQTYHDDQANGPQLMPKNDQEERDQWMLRFSNAVSHSMVPFMKDVWGIPLSDEAVDAVKFMPPWLPAVGGIEGWVSTTVGTPISFDLEGEALSHDGVALVGGLTAPSNGIILEEGGEWIYTPHATFKGDDIFSYTVTSSTGHTVESVVQIAVSNHGALLETWFDVEGSTIADLTSHPAYPERPDDTRIVMALEGPTNTADAYGSRLRAFAIPPWEGDVVFWIASDDHGELWISTDANPENATLVAHVPGWTDAKEWTKFPEQQSQPIALKKGEVITIEALMKEGGGGDNLAVAWAPVGAQPQLITQEHVNVYRDENTPPVAGDDALETMQGQEIAFDLLANDSDADADDIYVQWIGLTEEGVEIGTNDEGELIYQPPDGFFGEDRFNYVLADGHGGTDDAKVIITVNEAFPESDLGQPRDSDVLGGSDAVGGDNGTKDPPSVGPPGDDGGCAATSNSRNAIPGLLILTLGLLLAIGRRKKSHL